MYVVEKEQGNNSNITLINQDTKASVIIGKMTMEIIDILEEEGYKFNKDLGEDSCISLTEKWRLDITDEAGRKLASKALAMKKPVRNQSKKSEQKIDNKNIDAMDVLFGLAHYNN